jgi:histone-lysine N-methyltransferase SETD1
MGRIEYQRKENNYAIKINRMNLWINRNKRGGLAKYINHLCNPTCELVQCGWFAVHVLFLKKNINSGMELTFDYYWEFESGQVGTICFYGSDNCDG